MAELDCMAPRWKVLGQSHWAHPCHPSALSLPLLSPETRDLSTPFRLTVRFSSSLQGDCGGSLVCHKDGVWFLVGIVSWGSRDCSPSTPAVCAHITAPLPWIKEMMEKYCHS